MSADTQPAATPGPCRCGHSEREHKWLCGALYAMTTKCYEQCECTAYTPQEPPVTQPDEPETIAARDESAVAYGTEAPPVWGGRGAPYPDNATPSAETDDASHPHGEIHHEWNHGDQWPGRTTSCYCCGRTVRIGVSSDRFACNVMCQLRLHEPWKKEVESPAPPEPKDVAVDADAPLRASQITNSLPAEGGNKPGIQEPQAAPTLADEFERQIKSVTLESTIQTAGPEVCGLGWWMYDNRFLIKDALRYYAERERHAEEACIARMVRDGAMLSLIADDAERKGASEWQQAVIAVAAARKAVSDGCI